MFHIKFLFHLFAFSLFINTCSAQSGALISNWFTSYYSINNQNYNWLSIQKINRTTQWLDAIDKSDSLGLNPKNYNTEKIRTDITKLNFLDSAQIKKTNQEITELLLVFVRHLQQGNITLEYDEVSEDRDSLYLNLLLKSNPEEAISKVISNFDCKDKNYLTLKRFFNDSLTTKDTIRCNAIKLSMNYLRYVSACNKKDYILINIPLTELVYYKNALPTLKMKIVVGKSKSPTPIFASYNTYIETFPAWNVPRSIAVKEILPHVQKDEKYLEQHNFEVVNAKGELIDESELNWNNYNEKNFDYYFRQSTGADNALGVLKFYLKNPYSVFLHATSWQGVFEKQDRFLSHGCIRLEKPFELANEISGGKLNAEELKKGEKGTKTEKIILENKIPVFIIYQPVVVLNGQVTFLKDVYKLVK